MRKEISISISPKQAAEEKAIIAEASRHLGITIKQINGIKILRRSIDARKKNIKVNIKLEAYIDEPVPETNLAHPSYPNVASKSPVLIAGAGPAGLFAALKLIELGLKPIIIERGKDVKSRRRDLAAINKQHIVNSDSNYCFGEGGAGTYSDGKLYTRSTKRGDVNKILHTFVAHGASEDILIDAHPHIGTNKLPKIIVNMRESILAAGGEIYFNTRLTDILIEKGHVKGIQTIHPEKGEQQFSAVALILATGHSARDIFELLHQKGILLEAKSFAMGVRIEHPQELIDSIQYHCPISKVPQQREYLPAASYSLVHQAGDRGVYSFCMCPGGIIAPCATQQEEVVTNGWSPSKRNNPFANSGMVVAVNLEDLVQYKEHGVLAGLRYQQELERTAWIAGGKTQTAPAQRMIDFIQNKVSPTLPRTSYQPGVASVGLHEMLPPAIGKRLQEGLNVFGKKLNGYLTNEAVLVGVESRTSSTIRIPRDKETLEHPEVKGLYPCGEGAGYAGGIVSAAIDGEKCAVQCKIVVSE